MPGMEEALAAQALCDKYDKTRLSSKEIDKGWGSKENFFYCHGLKPWNLEDHKAALHISRRYALWDKQEQQNCSADT
eukprot:snap_masked-scaffold_34-processed-gene-3.48-mRNA-1 protein AED:1.00 eAED:1.00 QI:0/-1/0/0/-1/1/1/0/76